MRISKKILAIALSILMAVSMMPFTVFAATVEVNDVASFEAAVANASAGDTIKLTGDIDFREYPGFTRTTYDLSDKTVDLNGNTIISYNHSVVYVGDNFTIKNGNMVCEYDTAKNYKNSYAVVIYPEDGNWQTDVVNDKSENVVLENLVLTGGVNCFGADVTVKGSSTNITGNYYYALWADVKSTLTVEDGTFTSACTSTNGVIGACSDDGKEAKVDIKGGDYTVPADKNLVLLSTTPSLVDISGGTYKNANDTAYTVPAKYLAEGAAEDANGVVTQYVAEVNGVKYDTFEKALAAISTVTTATHSNAKDPTYQYKTYVANGTIKLLADTTSNGVIIGSGSNLTIDFNGKTLDINAKPVGSNGTESSAMQLLKDSDITFKNGTLTSTYTYASTDKEYIQRLIQNYANLTLDHMTVGMRGNFKNQLMMSNSNGNITITDSTVSAPDFSWANYSAEQAAESLGARAMSVGTFSTYTGVNVTVTDSTINGYVNIDNTGENGTAALTLNGSDVKGNIVDKSMNGSTVTNNSSTVDGIPAGYEWVDNGDGTSSLAEDTHSVAEVNGAKYDTFEDALAAISDVTTATHSNAKDPTYQYKTYVANGTIKLLQDCTTNGIIIGSGSDLTIDFNGKTLDITDKPVGSNGTETIGMQLLKDSDITFENGTLTSTADSSKKIVRLIQNYADLTLDNMTVSMKGNFYDQMTMSNCNGDITITGSTVSAPDFSWLGYSAELAAESLGTRVMSVGSFNSTAYPDVNVTVTNSTINGYVNIDNSAEGATAELTLDGSNVNGNIVDNNMNGSTVKNIGSDVDGVPEGYEWNASNVLAPIADVFNLDIEDSINMNMYINTEAYADDATIEVTYSTPELNDKTAKTTDTISASTLPRDSQNRVKLTVNAAPAQITDDVVIKVKSGNQVVHTVTTSVMAYCKEIIAKSNNAELVKLAETMLDYGKAANRSFKYTEPSRFNYNNGEDYYNFYYGNVDDTAVLDKTGNNGVFASYSYIATTVPALRLYTNLSESQCGNADGVVTKATITNVTKGTTTKVAPVVVDLGDDNKVVAIDITGILAEDLADVYAVEYKGSTIKLNAIQFAKAVKDTDRVDFGRAMFNYYVAANAYFK